MTTPVKGVVKKKLMSKLPGMGLLKTREDDASYNWQEWELQVVVVRDMRRLEDVDGRFTVAGDMNGVHLTNQQLSLIHI